MILCSDAKSSAVVGYQKTDWTISQLSKPMCFTAPRLLGGQGKATNFISRSSCSHDTMFKKGSFSTQIIHPQLTESWLFHFGLLKLKWKHFSLARQASVFCSRSVQRSFACGSSASQPLQKVGCSTPKCFVDCTPHLLWHFSFHIFPNILWETSYLVSFPQLGMKTNSDICKFPLRENIQFLHSVYPRCWTWIEESFGESREEGFSPGKII